jgi:hypothetical protein
MFRRLLAGSTAAAFLWPWLLVFVTALHLSLEHGHDHDVANRVVVALHGHEHEAGTPPHEHDAAPTSGKVFLSSTGAVASLISPVVILPACQQPSWISAAKRSPPQPTTASPPILRV